MLQVVFSVTWKDYDSKTNKRRGNRVASDLKHVLLQDLVEMLDTINGLTVTYQPPPVEPSRRRGGGQPPLSFYPDKPQDYIVCNTRYRLSTELHNRLCLLRGVLKELLPFEEDFLGSSSLPSVVKESVSFVGSFSP